MNAVLLNPKRYQPLESDDKVIGISYEKIKVDGSVGLGLKFEEDRILFVVGEYTNWQKIWPKVSKHLSLVLELVSERNPIVAYAVEYNDIFRAEGDYAEFDASFLLQPDSKYIPPHIFERDQNFHFHTGYFDVRSEPVEHQVLTRVNSDLRDGLEKDVRELSIVLFHQISSYLDPHTVGPWKPMPPLPEKIARRGLGNFVDLHDLDKDILRNILSDDMSAQIGL
ncbi:MAG: hypothetical protein OXE94_04050 [Aestuariivita sp.]|nr:hypothetical protein [Aestuariivita sp.]MCY4201611.1 hypothetical protein [Aestuariivita sp.]MCY4289723.1 hypothetical protein [Aestuariivita sp.]